MDIISFLPESVLREKMVSACRWLEAEGLNRGISSNVGCRSEDFFLVTPTRVPISELTAASMVALNFDGAPWGNTGGTPSSEWRIHRDVLKARTDINVVVHCHSPYATTLACLRQDIPALHYMIAAAGGPNVRCASYATFGSEELSQNTLTALVDRKACLMANHGMLAVGTDLDSTLALTLEIEFLCELYYRTINLGTLGRPAILSEAEMSEMLKQFESYDK